MSAESPPGQDWGRGHGAAEVAEPGFKRADFPPQLLLHWPRKLTNRELREAGLERHRLEEAQYISSWPRRGLRVGEGQQVFSLDL